jgi:hypothetical protein
MCLAMNDDRLKPGERCASTSNRNFEGRQGFKGRTHLVSPAMAAAAAIAGHFVDIREWIASPDRSCGAAPFTACKPCFETRRVEARSKSVPAPYIPDSLSKSVFPAVENGHWKGASWSGPSRGSSSGTCFCWASLPWE